MKRKSASNKAVLAVLGAVVLLFVGSFAGWSARGAAEEGLSEEGTSAGNALEVAVMCEGWTESNVALGAFVSGSTSDGSPFDEQVSLPEPGMQEVRLPAGGFRVTPCASRIMLDTGEVLAANDVGSCRFANGDGGSERVELVYQAVDLAFATDEELAEIAADSFVDETASQRALELAKGLRDAAPVPNLDTPDIDGETPADAPGLPMSGGE